ncbi:BA14K family protein [Neorhizobium sp. NCHU2750]|uniref:BA14K family protein n=1 Tax=Neorhizobium sp. NCHU2750 TaxID=1825976 RepID=UPI000E761C6A|nr:membrane protein [Neorhizobium sp. NCHU2750]
MTLFRKLAVAAVSALVLAGSIGSAEALPLPAAPSAPLASDVTNVQYYRHGPPRGGYYGGGPRRGWYGGYRGYPGYRHGYRRYSDGYWYPLAAFGAGAIIGGAIAAPRYVEPAPAPIYHGAGLNPRHYEWCSSRYRSYDSYSNTFQPFNGPRQTCYSPYF